MASKFNIVAELQLQGPKNLRSVVNDIKRQLSNVNINVTLNTGNLNQQVNQTSKNLNQLNKSSRSAQQNMSNLGKSGTQASRGVGQAASSLQEAATAAESFGKQSALAVKRFAAFTVGAGILGSVAAAFKEGTAAAVSFERELVKVSQVTGTALNRLGGLTTEITKLSSSLGVSSAELVNVSRTLAQTGLSAREVTVALKALAQSSLSPTFKDMSNTVEGAISIMRQFGVEADRIGKKLGSINALAGSFAVEAQDLVFAVRRAGGAFKAAGGSLEELLALFTSVRATTRESAETIATGFRTIFTRMQRPKTIEFLKQAGVELQNFKGHFVGPYEAVRRLNKALSQLESTDPRFQQIIEELGGFRQVSKVIPLIQQFGTAQKALGVAMRGQDSIIKDAKTAQQSLIVQMAKVREQFLGFMRDVANSDSFKGLASGALTIASAFIKVAESLKPILPMMTAFAAFKVAQVGFQFTKGFMGGFRGGGGASGMGQRLGGGGGGKGGGIQAATRHAQAVTNNTKSLEKLTSAVVRLTASFDRMQAASSLGRRPYKGGKPRFGPGFATGGVVPGTGSGDTVPAMLEPGEFVVRKSSVQKYGAENLQKLNGGGGVKPGDVSRKRRFGPGAQSYANSRSKRFAKRMGGGAGKAYAFDFDDTLAESDAVVHEGADDPYSEFRGKKGAGFVRSAKATKIAGMAQRRASRGHDIYVVTARPNDKSTKRSIGHFMRGVGAPAKDIIGVGGTPGPGGTSEKKAQVLRRLKKQYGDITFLDDDDDNVLAASKVAGVKSIKARKNRGGFIPRSQRRRFSDGGFSDFLQGGGDSSSFALGEKGMGAKVSRGRGKNIHKEYGGAFLAPTGAEQNLTLSIPFESALAEAMEETGPKTRGKLKEKAGMSPKGNKLNVSLHAGALSESVAEDFRTKLRQSIETFSDAFAKKNFPGMNYKPDKFQHAYKLANPEQVEGNIFEAAISGLSNAPYNEDRIKANETFDFPQGLGTAAPIFGVPKGIPTDAKRTMNRDSIESLVRKAVAQTKKEAIQGVSADEFGGTKERRFLSKENAAGVKLRRALGLTKGATNTEVGAALDNNPAMATKLRLKKDSKDKWQRFATGGNVKKRPTQRDFSGGQIAIRGGIVTARYGKGSGKEGQVTASKMFGDLWEVNSSEATKGFGPHLYDMVMEGVTSKGGRLTSDRASVSPSARKVWEYYYSKRPDVRKSQLKTADWPMGDLLDMQKFASEDPSTWPPKNDVRAWALNYGYAKSPNLINNKSKVKRMAEGGSAEDTVPALLTPGEFVINKKSADRIGHNKLHAINKGRVQGFNKGGPVGVSPVKMAAGGEAKITNPEALKKYLSTATGVMGKFFENIKNRFEEAEDYVTVKRTGKQAGVDTTKVRKQMKEADVAGGKGVMGGAMRAFAKYVDLISQGHAKISKGQAKNNIISDAFIAHLFGLDNAFENVTESTQAATTAATKAATATNTGKMHGPELPPGYTNEEGTPSITSGPTTMGQPGSIPGQEKIKEEKLDIDEMKKSRKERRQQEKQAAQGGAGLFEKMMGLQIASQTLIETFGGGNETISKVMGSLTQFAMLAGMAGNVLNSKFVQGGLKSIGPSGEGGFGGTMGSMSAGKAFKIGKSKGGGGIKGTMRGVGAMGQTAEGATALTGALVAAGMAVKAFGDQAMESALKTAESAKSEAEAQQAREKYEKGARMSTAGSGAATGAGVGAMMGALAGPAGMVIGAAAGAVIGGIIGAFIEPDMTPMIQAIERGRQTRILDEQTKILKRIEKSEGGMGGTADLSKYLTTLGQMDRQIATATGIEQQEKFTKDFEGQSSVTSGILDSIVKQTAESGGGFDAVSGYGGGQGMEFMERLAQMENIPVEDIIKRYQNQIDMATKLEKARQAELAAINKQRDFVNILNETKFAFREMSDVVSVAANRLNGLQEGLEGGDVGGQFGGAAVQTGVLGRAAAGEKVNMKTLNSALEQVSPGGGGAEDKIANQVRASAVATEKLPDMLLAAAKESEKNNSSLETTLAKQLDANNITGPIRDVIMSGLTGQTVGDQKSDAAARKRILSGDGSAMAGDMLSENLGNQLAEGLQAIAESIVKAQQELNGMLQKRNSMEAKLTSIRLKGLQKRNQLEDIVLTKAGADKDAVTFEKVRERDMRQQKVILGQGRGREGVTDASDSAADTTGEVQALGLRYQAIQMDIQAQKDHISSLKIGSDEHLKAKEKLNKLTQESGRLGAALNHVADSSARLQKAQDDLAKIRAQREYRQGVAADFAFGTADERRDQGLGFAAVDAFARQTGGSDGGMLPQQLIQSGEVGTKAAKAGQARLQAMAQAGVDYSYQDDQGNTVTQDAGDVYKEIVSQQLIADYQAEGKNLSKEDATKMAEMQLEPNKAELDALENVRSEAERQVFAVEALQAAQEAAIAQSDQIIAGAIEAGTSANKIALAELAVKLLHAETAAAGEELNTAKDAQEGFTKLEEKGLTKKEAETMVQMAPQLEMSDQSEKESSKLLGLGSAMQSNSETAEDYENAGYMNSWDANDKRHEFGASFQERKKLRKDYDSLSDEDKEKTSLDSYIRQNTKKMGTGDLNSRQTFGMDILEELEGTGYSREGGEEELIAAITKVMERRSGGEPVDQKAVRRIAADIKQKGELGDVSVGGGGAQGELGHNILSIDAAVSREGKRMVEKGLKKEEESRHAKKRATDAGVTEEQVEMLRTEKIANQKDTDLQAKAAGKARQEEKRLQQLTEAKNLSVIESNEKRRLQDKKSAGFEKTNLAEMTAEREKAREKMGGQTIEENLKQTGKIGSKEDADELVDEKAGEFVGKLKVEHKAAGDVRTQKKEAAATEKAKNEVNDKKRREKEAVLKEKQKVQDEANKRAAAKREKEDKRKAPTAKGYHKNPDGTYTQVGTEKQANNAKTPAQTPTPMQQSNKQLGRLAADVNKSKSAKKESPFYTDRFGKKTTNAKRIASLKSKKAKAKCPKGYESNESGQCVAKEEAGTQNQTPVSMGSAYAAGGGGTMGGEMEEMGNTLSNGLRPGFEMFNADGSLVSQQPVMGGATGAPAQPGASGSGFIVDSDHPLAQASPPGEPARLTSEQRNALDKQSETGDATGEEQTMDLPTALQNFMENEQLSTALNSFVEEFGGGKPIIHEIQGEGITVTFDGLDGLREGFEDLVIEKVMQKIQDQTEEKRSKGKQ